MTHEINFEGTRLTVASRDAQFGKLSEVHPDTEPADETGSVTRVMRIYTQALSRLTDTHPDPTVEEVQEWLDELDLRALGIAFGEEYDTKPSQFLENWYSKCLQVIVEEFQGPRSAGASQWVEEIDDRFQSLIAVRADAFDRSELYTNAYSMSVLSVVEACPDPDSDAASRWIDVIDALVDSTLEEQLPDADPVQFRENFFANVFIKLHGEYGTHPNAAEWFATLQKQADETASSPKIRDASNFLINIYSMTLSKLTQPSSGRTPDSERIQSWFGTFEDGLVSTAVSDCHESASGGYLVNIYAQATTRLTLHRRSARDPETAAWLDQFERMVERTSTDPAHQMTAGDFLANYYAFTLEEILDRHSDPDQASHWLDELAHRTVNAGLNKQHDHSPAGFVAYVFVMTRLNMAADGDTVEAGQERKRVQLMGAYLANVLAGDLGEYFAMAPKVHRLYTVDSPRAIKQDVLAAVAAVGEGDRVECSRTELIENAAGFVAAGFVYLYDNEAYTERFTDRVRSHAEDNLAEQPLVDEFAAAIDRTIAAHDDGWKVRLEWTESTDTS